MDLDTGEQILLRDTLQDEGYPIISADGSKLVYRAGAIYQKPTSGDVVEKVCDDCGDPHHWSSDGTKILHRIGSASSSISVVDLTTRENLPVLRHPDYHIFGFIAGPQHVWVSVARDKMVFSMREITGNIWVMERVEAVP